VTQVHNVTTSEPTSAVPGSPAPMRVPLLDFAREYAEIGPEIMAAVEAVFCSQRFVLGPEVASFEQAAAHDCGVAEAIGCGSGTDALWLAMAAAGDYFAQNRPEFKTNIQRYFEYIRENDLVLTHTLVNLQRSRNSLSAPLSDRTAIASVGEIEPRTYDR